MPYVLLSRIAGGAEAELPPCDARGAAARTLQQAGSLCLRHTYPNDSAAVVRGTEFVGRWWAESALCVRQHSR